ncbi:cytokine receptor common subunit gamma-like isoform X3 [Protopterus annectens]|nr:cytokine receptor common subunit gamma-like isoform X3 [Protopterus annectens]
MICNWTTTGKPYRNYSLNYSYGKIKKECKNYSTESGYNSGCRIENVTEMYFKDFFILLIDANTSTEIKNKFKLQDLVKPNPPFNLVVTNTSNNQLKLTWNVTMKLSCLQFDIKYKSNKETNWTMASIQEKLFFDVPSVDPKKLYTFYVRSKKIIYCGTTDLWSEWSLPAYWGQNDSATNTLSVYFWLRYVVAPVVSFLVLVLLCYGLMRAERLWIIIIPKIPNPERNFHDLFYNYGGNFQDWVGMTKETLEGFKPNYSEMACNVSEQPLHDSQQSEGFLDPATLENIEKLIPSDQKLSTTSIHETLYVVV